MTADYWLLHSQLVGMLEGYLGLGVYGAVSLAAPSWYAVGIRMPIALQLWPLDNEMLELFLEVAPTWVPLTSVAFDPAGFQVQMAIGFRVWP
jgi:hypothetical protein